MTHETVEMVKAGIDLASASMLIAYLIGFAPAIATVFSAIWAVLRTVDQAKKMGLIGRSPPPPSPYEPID